MWIWWYSFAINLFLWTKSYGSMSALPLFLVVVFGLYDVVSKFRNFEEYEFELLMACIGICVLLLITMIHIYAFSIYLGFIIFVYLLKKGKDIFLYPPKFIRLANAFSFLSSIMTYLLLYAAMEKEVDKYIPLIPFAINFITESLILFHISRGNISGLNPDFCYSLAYNRALFSISTIVLFLIAILYTLDIIAEVIIFSSSTVLYAVALVYINLENMAVIKCRPLYSNLKNKDIN